MDRRHCDRRAVVRPASVLGETRPASRTESAHSRECFRESRARSTVDLDSKMEVLPGWPRTVPNHQQTQLNSFQTAPHVHWNIRKSARTGYDVCSSYSRRPCRTPRFEFLNTVCV